MHKVMRWVAIAVLSLLLVADVGYHALSGLQYVVTGYEYFQLTDRAVSRISYRLPDGGIGRIDKLLTDRDCLSRVGVGYSLPSQCR